MGCCRSDQQTWPVGWPQAKPALFGTDKQGVPCGCVDQNKRCRMTLRLEMILRILITQYPSCQFLSIRVDGFIGETDEIPVRYALCKDSVFQLGDSFVVQPYRHRSNDPSGPLNPIPILIAMSLVACHQGLRMPTPNMSTRPCEDY